MMQVTVATDQAEPGADAEPEEEAQAVPEHGGGMLGRVKFLVELLVMTMLLYYVDIVLDIQSLKEMWVTGNPGLCFLNSLGIAMASLLGSILMARKIDAGIDATKRSLWVGGCLYLPQLHVLYFGFQSLLAGAMHPLLFEAKFVESTVESVASASVQVYFLIWAELEWERKRWILLSVCSSFCTLAFCNAGFDLRDRGIARVRGSVASMVSGQFLTILTFRLCEIVTRIGGLALFQRACRPFGAITVVFIDFIIMMLLTWSYAGSWEYAMPSVFAHMNPILEQGNAASVPCRTYFAVRFLELTIMAGVAAWWRGAELTELYEDDVEVVIGFAAGLVGTLALLPVVPCSAQDTLLSYPPTAWLERPFSVAERKLLKDLLSRTSAPASEDAGYVPLEAASEARLLEPLRSRLPPAFDFTSARISSQVADILTLAQNCPVWAADDQLKVTLVKLLGQLTDVKEMASRGKPSMQREVIEGGGLEISLELAAQDGASAELQQHALALALRTLSASLVPGESLSPLAEEADRLAKKVLTQQGSSVDKGTVAAAAQAAVVAEAFGGAPADLLLLGPLAAGGVLTACQQGTLVSVPPQASVLKVLEERGSEPLPWGDTQTESGSLLGGLCVSELQRRRRQGEAVEAEFSEGSNEQRWAKELRTPVEEVKALLSDLETHDRSANLQTLGTLKSMSYSNPESMIKAGCSAALQKCFLESEDDKVRRFCLQVVNALMHQCHRDAARSLFHELAKSYTQAFFEELNGVIASASVSKGKVDIYSLAGWATGIPLYMAMTPALHVKLLPLMPAVISLARRGLYMALATAYNMSLAESSRPRLREVDGLSKLLTDVATNKVTIDEADFIKLSPEAAIFNRYLALQALCNLLQGKDDDLRHIVLQQEHLELLLDYLLHDWPKFLAAYVPVMPFVVLVALREAEDALRKRNIVEALCKYCLKTGLEDPDREQGIGYALRALATLFTYSESATSVNVDENVCREFKGLVKAAKERPTLKAWAEDVEWHFEL